MTYLFRYLLLNEVVQFYESVFQFLKLGMIVKEVNLKLGHCFLIINGIYVTYFV